MSERNDRESLKRERGRLSEWSKYLRLTDLSKWITRPVRAEGESERVERGNEQQRERDACV